MLDTVVKMFVVVRCLTLWLVCLGLVLYGLMTSAISCPLWSSVYECQRVECALTSRMRTELKKWSKRQT